MEREGYAGAEISVGCMLAINNIVESIKKTDNPQQQIIAMVGFGCLCVANKDFLKIRESDKAQWEEDAKVLQQMALNMQKEMKEDGEQSDNAH